MTNDLVARLRHEGDDEAVEALRLQEASIRRLVRKLAAAEAKEHKSFQQYVDANEARIEAEARARELEAERDKWDRRVAYDELQAREHENRATQQHQIDALTIRAEAAERRLAETYERAAKVAEEMPNMIAIGPKHVRGLRGSDVAAAIRQFAQVKHEAE